MRGTRSGRRKLALWIGATVAVVAVGLGVGVWYFVFRDTAPPAVTLADARRSLRDEQGGADSGSTDGSIEGTWSVDTEIGEFADFTSTFVGYRVQEELAGIGAKTAAGRTPDVTGTLVVVGSQVVEVQLDVDMTTLVSDEARRDRSLQRQALETSRFPDASFDLTTPIALPDAAVDGTVIHVDATGELTLHGVTREVAIPLEAKLDGDTIVVTGSLDIRFADYDIDQPTSFVVLSVEDHGSFELQLFFSRS